MAPASIGQHFRASALANVNGYMNERCNEEVDVVRIRIMYNARSRQSSRTHVSVTLMLCNVNLFIMRIGELYIIFGLSLSPRGKVPNVLSLS